MPDEQANSNEGADPSGDIQKQNPGGTTLADITGGNSDGSSDPDDGETRDAEEAPDNEAGDGPTKVQDLAKAGREDFDPNLGQE